MTKNFIVLLLAFWTSITLVSQPDAKMRTRNKIRAGIPPYTVIKSVLSANESAINKGLTGKAPKTTPHLTWLAESDERIVSAMVASPSTPIFSVRNFGNQLELSSGAIDYGVRHLLSPVLLITSSSGNKAVELFMDGYEDLSPAIRRELDHLHLALYKDDKKLSRKNRLIINVEANVDYQVDMAIARYQDRVVSGRLVVVGSILDFENNYQHGAGNLIIINVNGERSSNKLKKMQIMKSMSSKAMKVNIGRDRPKSAPAKKPKKN